MLLQVSLLVILLASSGGTPYYITPSYDTIAGNDTCFFEGRPLDPCTTLETLVVNSRTAIRNPDGNLTLLFLPGSYVIRNDTYLKFRSLNEIILSPYKNESAIGIKCYAEMIIDISAVEKIIIASVQFYSCGGEDYFIRVLGSTKKNIVQILNSSFIGNIGSAIFIDTVILQLTIVRSRFEFIRSSQTGAANVVKAATSNPYHTSRITANISDSIFTNNLIGALLFRLPQSSRSLYIKVTKTSFINNTSSLQGGAINIHGNGISLSLTDCKFHNNTVATQNGGAIELFTVIGRTSIKITNCTFYNNMARNDGGAIKLSIEGGGRFYNVNITDCTFLANTCTERGGGMMLDLLDGLVSSKVQLNNVIFEKNSAKTGGGMYINTRAVCFENHMIFRENSAEDGGALSIENTMLTLFGKSEFINNEANSNGGALKASRSRITFNRDFYLFENNTAGKRGGALFLSKTFLHTINQELYFIQNMAAFGGALFVEDFSENCEKESKCFYADHHRSQSLYFQENVANEGPILYGGLLNSCHYFIQSLSAIQIFISISNTSSTDFTQQSITSDVVDFCFCDNEQRPNCSLKHKYVSAIRGESISLLVITLDQNKSFKKSLISNCDDSTLTLGEGECHYNIDNPCTNVNIHVYSKQSIGNLVIKSEGPCREMNKLTVKVAFQQCPQGFQLATSEDRCECDKRLASTFFIKCHIHNKAIELNSNGWFKYDNGTLQVCKNCPLDYCDKDKTFILIKDINDSQCANNRSGVACGACKDFFSVVLGSSKCYECSGPHKYFILWLVPLFAFMGLILVLSMLFVDLTVSIGLINGLIFYSNI